MKLKISKSQLAIGNKQLAKPANSRAFRIITPLPIAYCLLFIVFGACKKWVDVKPSDRLSENQLFSTREGFLRALNGVYVEMTNAALYGENMSVSAIDVLAGYYCYNSSTAEFADLTTYSYTTDRMKPVFDNMWKKSYELILNCNVIIEQCGENGNPLLPGPYFGVVKGEALALRAMLHLDMLRLFGPIYSAADKNKPCIPYNTSSRAQSSALLGSEEVMQHIIDDLTAAIALLKDADPVITDGVRSGGNPNGTNDMYYRQYRLNYYAAKALLARAYLWKQDKEKALQEAQQLLAAVTDPAMPIFKPGVASATATVPDFDHLVVSEVMFSLYTINRQNTYLKYFSPDLLNEYRLSFNFYDDLQGRKNELYDDQNDFRLKAWLNLSNASATLLTHIKFAVTKNSPGPNMMPLIRLSEVILIAAECSNSIADGTKYLNMVRTSRNCVSLAPTTATQLKDYITREFRKEVFGEGQMFFYYKRNAMTAVPNHAALTGTKQMILSNYVVPLPASEISVRGN